MNSYSEKEEIKKEKEAADRLLLKIEVVLSYISIISFLVMFCIAIYIKMPTELSIALIGISVMIISAGIGYAVKIEQIAGYYECGVCHHRYIPSYASVLFSAHIGRTRSLRCPECNKKSWNKKVLTK